jgi:crotonobetainyl-CoA:carnitine CoA-transferase CaiB-like acyl-CoA transferase
VNVVPHSHYPTRDNRWIAIACTNDKIFARLAEVMARPDLAEKWATLAARENDRAIVDETVAEWTSRFDRSVLLNMCEAAQVPCGPVYSIDEIFEDPQYAARENILRVNDMRIGELAVPNLVPRLSATPGQVNWLGQELGAHNDEIYRGLLGLDDTELQRLRAAAVI